MLGVNNLFCGFNPIFNTLFLTRMPSKHCIYQVNLFPSTADRPWVSNSMSTFHKKNTERRFQIDGDLIIVNHHYNAILMPLPDVKWNIVINSEALATPNNIVMLYSDEPIDIFGCLL